MGNTTSKVKLLRSSSLNSTRRKSLARREDQGSIVSNKLPNEQIEEWKEHHYLLKECWGENFLAPVNEWLRTGIKVLDVGCGTGTWLNDVGLEYPLSEFVGVDILSLFPAECFPTNIEFVQADIKLKLPFADDTFDYVHMRHMILYFTEREWINAVIPELTRVLKPDGYLELAEADLEWCNISPTTESLIAAAHNLMRQRGIDPFMINRLYDILENTEMFQTIYHKEQEAQIGKWANQTGEKLLNVCLQLFSGIRTSQCKILKISYNEFDNLLQQFKNDVEIHKTYCKAHRFYAAKKSL